jgi:hypothetical protein
VSPEGAHDVELDRIDKIFRIDPVYMLIIPQVDEKLNTRGNVSGLF